MLTKKKFVCFVCGLPFLRNRKEVKRKDFIFMFQHYLNFSFICT
jgi:hypothetical protein